MTNIVVMNEGAGDYRQLSAGQGPLSELLDSVESGEEVIITRRWRAVAHIRPAFPPKKPLPFEKLAALRTRVSPWGKNSADLVREMRDDERY